MCEPAQSEPGTKLDCDLAFFIAIFSFTLLCEAAIWLPSMKHKRLAKYGLPVSAKIEQFKFSEYGGREQVEALLSYTLDNKQLY
jgi:hypothetical protein